MPLTIDHHASTATNLVFETLYNAIVTLELPPGTKVSEAEIAKELGVSRQPVRDAFYRLSEVGFVRIRPQRATTITYISDQALHDARFIRTALEVECLRIASAKIRPADIDALEHLLGKQADAISAGNKLAFHELDDIFHRTITEIAGHPNAWALIRDQKVHLDRVRYLSLAFGAQDAFDDHRVILDCLKAGDAAKADARLRAHLSTILKLMDQLRATHSNYFEALDEDAKPIPV